MSQGYAKNLAGATGTIGPTGPAGATGAVGATGPQGLFGQPNSGISIIDFGSIPGSNRTYVAVTGQSNILLTSTVQAFLMADTTVSGAVGHNAEEHKLIDLNLTCGNIIPGTGFTIYARTTYRLTSVFQIRWVWS